MPNNGIISRYANLPEEYKVSSTSGFNTTTDTVVVNQALDNGSKVAQKALTLSQLGSLVGGSLPYKEYIGRAVFGAGQGGYLFQGYSTLSSGVIGSRISQGVYTYTFPNSADFDGNITKYIFDFRISASTTNIYNIVSYNDGANAISINIYQVNPSTGEYSLVDPTEQATFYYRKYN